MTPSIIKELLKLIVITLIFVVAGGLFGLVSQRLCQLALRDGLNNFLPQGTHELPCECQSCVTFFNDFWNFSREKKLNLSSAGSI